MLHTQPFGSKIKSLWEFTLQMSKIQTTKMKEDHPLRVSELIDLRHPAKPVLQNELYLNGTVITNENLRKK